MCSGHYPSSLPRFGRVKSRCFEFARRGCWVADGVEVQSNPEQSTSPLEGGGWLFKAQLHDLHHPTSKLDIRNRKEPARYCEHEPAKIALHQEFWGRGGAGTLSSQISPDCLVRDDLRDLDFDGALILVIILLAVKTLIFPVRSW